MFTPFHRLKEAGTPLTPEKRTELLNLLGGRDDLLDELLTKANARIGATTAAAANTSLKAEGDVALGDVATAAADTAAVAADVAAEAEEASEETAETDDRLLTDAEIDLIADRVVGALVARFDDVQARLSSLDTEMKARGYSRAKDDAAGDDGEVIDAAEFIRRLKAVEDTLGQLTEDDLPTSVLSILGQRPPAGIVLKAEEADQILTDGISRDPLAQATNFLFGGR